MRFLARILTAILLGLLFKLLGLAPAAAENKVAEILEWPGRPNYILHPYWGAAYYIRARERGFERMSA